ncbi:Rhodanese-like protein [Emticicia oligotrophica DSM 17448]|uniref:Rhodanese-like protein n=1 Tax=Emticicia oligotrophica (strain DSM 17448 / CIP 109782 / MTCC 6937 / GPTSA100-15) TaxID=929562 RepID=A0ABN4APD4_EMTOG|nr:rhodanese-like domain-containing protein [Emticicia oligotrophica]AFK04267.1 Rhodanese-like protein [Emticicia oligotrophica DSM 17448]
MFEFLKPKKTYENVSATDFRKLISENPDAIILDVRTPAEFSQGAIKGAVNMDIMEADFGTKVAKLDKSKTYLVYCRSGNRSGSACSSMRTEGFDKVYNLAGGLMNY